MTYGGTLALTVSGEPLGAGDVFKLFDALTYRGTFNAVGLPALAPGLAWDIRRLSVDGTVKVVDSRQGR